MNRALLPLLLSVSLAACGRLAPDSASDDADGVRRAVARLDYVGGEYEDAVKDGEVVDAHEYEEAEEMVGEARELAREHAGADASRAVDAVAAAIDARAPAPDVERLVGEARRLLLAGEVIAPPEHAPLSEARAATNWTARCASCHGAAGGGDGPAAAGMKPPPRNLRDPEVMETFTPLRAYSAVTDGIAETAMPAFADLSEEERWELAFWVVGLRHDAPPATGAAPSAAPAPAALADASDVDLRARLHAREETLAWLRRVAPWRRANAN
jgi:high-affinity iron transporter